MKTLANLTVKPCISPGSFVIAVLVGNAIVDGYWLTAAIVFVVGMTALGFIALAADGDAK